MAFSIGQKILAPTVVGGIGMGGYSAYDKYANNNMYADPQSSMEKGAMAGAAIGAFGVSKQVSRTLSKKVSVYTNPTGASSESLKLFNKFT